jgi:hypothetical protein
MTTWTAQQVQAAEDAVNGINRQLEKIASTGSVLSDIGEYGLSGGILAQMGFSKEEIDAVGQAIDSTISSLNDLAQAYVDVAQAAVDAAQEQVDAAQKVLDNEIEARNNGYANSVETAKKELAAAEKTEQQKEKQLRKAQRAQEALDSAEQTSSLITATALLWKSYSGMGPASVALAIAATAAMWGSFTIAKIKAVQATKASSSTYGEGGMEILEGGSHISGNDIDLHQKNRKGKNMRAEGGEAMIIINKQRTKKYAKVLPEIVTSLNKGVFEEKFTKLFGNTEQLAPIVNIGSTSVDMTRVEHELSAIRKQGEDRYNVLPDGTFIICSGNVKRIVKRL